MDKLEAAALYAALNILVLLALATMTTAARIRGRVLIGDGGDPALLRAMRAHGNATEYVPAALVGLALFALLPASPLWAVHALGGALTVGRVLHGLGLSATEGRSFGRAVGFVLTYLVYVGLAVGLIWAALA